MSQSYDIQDELYKVATHNIEENKQWSIYKNGKTLFSSDNFETVKSHYLEKKMYLDNKYYIKVSS